MKVFEGVGGWRGSRFYIYLFCGACIDDEVDRKVVLAISEIAVRGDEGWGRWLSHSAS